MEKQAVKGLPANAFDVLPPGSDYAPYIPAGQIIAEVTARSVILGLIMSVVFSAAAAFLGLKIGQVFEAAIPIAIIAVGVSPLFKRKSTILENVIIQSIGAASGLIVAGAIFTLPALFILGLDKKIGIDLFQIFMVSFLGGDAGHPVSDSLPQVFREGNARPFPLSRSHGHHPDPGGRGEGRRAGPGAGQEHAHRRHLMTSSFTRSAPGRRYFSTRIFGLGKSLAEKAKIVFKLDVLSAVMGLGYIIGLRYTAIIAAGSLLSWFLLVPLVSTSASSSRSRPSATRPS